MKGPIQWMTGNHVAANLLMLVFVAGGLVFGMSIKQEVFPEVSLDTIQVAVVYPGAGPEEIEEGIILKVEESLSEIDGIREIKAQASEGLGIVNAFLRTGENADLILQDVKSAVDRIITFPEDAEEPVVTKLLNRREVVSVVVYGDLSERSLREKAEGIRDELLDYPEITQVELGGVRPYEISIEISEENLRRYNLTLDAVARRVRSASLDLPGGSVKTQGKEIFLRTKERRYTGREYADVVVLEQANGTEVRLGDIAEVKDAFRETDEFAIFDDKPAAMVKVFRVGDQKPTDISRIVEQYVEGKNEILPPSLRLSVWNDTTDLFKSRRDLLIKNATIGLCLVLIVLGLFLEIRLALWVMLGIPISFLGALLFSPVLDVSINMISLFAFIMALGIVVDDAIIVGENIYEHRQMGKPYLQAAIEGAIEVYRPVTFSVLTTVVAFSPLIFVSGLMGKFIRTIPLVVISIFIISLVESLFILPAHLGFGKPLENPRGAFKRFLDFHKKFGAGLERFIQGPYRRFLQFCVCNRYVTLASAVALLFVCVGLVGGGFVKFRFMPAVEGDVVLVELEMSVGTPVRKTAEVHDFITLKARDIFEEYDQALGEKNSVLRNIYGVVGGTLAKGGPMGEEGTSGGNLANIAVFLQPSEERDTTSSEIVQRWRERVGEIPGVESLTFISNLIDLGANIDVQLAHTDFGVLEKASVRLKEVLEGYPAVSNIADNYARGQKELKITLKPAARTQNITEEDLGRQVRAAFFGSEALRLQRGRNEVKVMVRYPEKERRSLWSLEQMRIRTPDGGELPLGRAAHIQEGEGFSEINRTDRKRVVSVMADVDSASGNTEEIVADLRENALKSLLNDFPGLTYDMGGEQKEQKDSINSMKKGFILALFCVYALLAIPFRSYSQPLLIMTAIPFGVVGAILGHLIMGYDLSILSMFGIVALSGVVVNDSLLLIDRINSRLREGQAPIDSVLEAGTRRFRPIMLTSLTTFFGLMPMILETSMQAKFLIPMAISLGFGILFATGITLIFLPSLYLILEDIRGALGLRAGHADHSID